MYIYIYYHFFLELSKKRIVIILQCGHMNDFIQDWSCLLSFSTDHLCLLGDYCVLDEPIKIKGLKVVHQPVIYCTFKPPPPSYNYPSSSLLYLYLLETSLLMEETLLLNKQWQVLQWKACRSLHWFIVLKLSNFFFF
jgi:hypothetical protein